MNTCMHAYYGMVCVSYYVAKDVQCIYLDMHACSGIILCMGSLSYMHGKVHTLIKQSVINGMYIIPHMPHIYTIHAYTCANN